MLRLNVKLSLEKGDVYFDNKFDKEELLVIKNIGLLANKPIMYVSNVNDDVLEEGNSFSNLVDNYASKKGLKSMRISSKIEEELSSFDDIKEKENLMKSLGIKKSGLDLFIT